MFQSLHTRLLASCALACFGVVLAVPSTVGAQTKLSDLAALAGAEQKPFVIVEAKKGKAISRAQGVVIGKGGLVLTVGHVNWVPPSEDYADKFRVSFRGKGPKLPQDAAHLHATINSNLEQRKFYEFYYNADLIRDGQSRFIEQQDLSLIKIETKRELPVLEFYSQQRPELEIGDTLYLCHYCFPHQQADPTFLINPIRVVGIAQTHDGLQCVAKGFYRLGSSGGAILKDGKLVGIQSRAYTINDREGGEDPQGLVSFQLVWKEMFDRFQEPGDQPPSAEPKPVSKQAGKPSGDRAADE